MEKKFPYMMNQKFFFKAYKIQTNAFYFMTNNFIGWVSHKL